MSYNIPGKLVVTDFSLINNITEKSTEKTNIWRIVDGVTIYESIFGPNLWGQAKIIDSYNLYNTLPINNNTYLRFAALDPTTGKSVSKTFKVFSVSNVEQLNPSLQQYVIKFISIEAYNSRQVRISRRVQGNIPSEIESIHKQISGKGIVVTKDSAKANIYLPYLSADQAISLLVNNATWNGAFPDYCYWETFSAFNCKSLTACMFESPIHDFSTASSFSREVYEGFNYNDFIKINETQVTNTFDELSILYNGFSGGTVCTVDPITGDYTSRLIGDNAIARVYNFPCNSLDYQMLSKRNQLLNTLRTSFYFINVPGLLSRESGDLANVTIYSSNNLGVKDKVLSGRKLICGIAHMISIDDYQQNITLGDYYVGS